MSEPPQSLDLDTAKAALEQVNKRMDAELALKSSTETRALTLAGQCTTLLSALTAALLIEAYGNQRAPLLAAGAAGGACLFAAIVFAYISARPRKLNFLPGRLPEELWDDLVAPDMKGPEFMARLMMGLQDTMVINELNQATRARALSNAIWMVKFAVPLAILAAIIVTPIAKHLVPAITGVGQHTSISATVPTATPSPSSGPYTGINPSSAIQTPIPASPKP